MSITVSMREKTDSGRYSVDYETKKGDTSNLLERIELGLASYRKDLQQALPRIDVEISTDERSRVVTIEFSWNPNCYYPLGDEGKQLIRWAVDSVEDAIQNASSQRRVLWFTIDRPTYRLSILG